MVKRIAFLGGLIGCLVSGLSYAGSTFSFYIAPGFNYDDITAAGVSTFNEGAVNYQGVNPRLTIGVGNLCVGVFYFGLEAFGNPIKPVTIHNDVGPAPNESLRPSWSYGGSILAGMHMDDVVSGFARAGVLYTQFDIPNTKRTGLQVGVGAEAILCAPWSVRLEYMRTQYKHIGIMSNVHTDSGALSAVLRIG